jgi:hypothetical protein
VGSENPTNSRVKKTGWSSDFFHKKLVPEVVDSRIDSTNTRYWRAKSVRKPTVANPITTSLLAAYEEGKKSTAQQAKERAAQTEAEERQKLENLLDPFRKTFNSFDKEQDRLAFNFLIRLQNKIFDNDDYEYYDLDFGQGGGVQNVLLSKVTKRGEQLFHALKHTHGFLSFITWVRFYDSFDKMCTAQSVCERLGWVLRYGKDKADVEKDLKRKAESPEFAHSLTTPLGFVNQRTKRSLDRFQVRTVLRKAKNSSSKRGGKNEAEKVRKIIESDQVQRDLIKRDIVVLQFEMAKKGRVRK